MMYKEYIVPLREEENDCGLMINAVIRVQPELIRCKDCKAYLPETETLASYCPILKIYGLPEDAYCYKAQRKKNKP